MGEYMVVKLSLSTGWDHAKTKGNLTLYYQTFPEKMGNSVVYVIVSDTTEHHLNTVLCSGHLIQEWSAQRDAMM